MEYHQILKIHLTHLNVNSLLPKIDEIRYVAERTKAAVIGVTESKLDEYFSIGNSNR